MSRLRRADVIVVGLRAMGSATCLQLAARGASVIGIDRYEPPHVYGSTHGETRITPIRQGFEQWRDAPIFAWEFARVQALGGERGSGRPVGDRGSR